MTKSVIRMSLKEQRQKKFFENKRRKITQDIKAEGGSQRLFKSFEHKVSDEQLLNFLLQANYGDTQCDPVLEIKEVAEELLHGVFQHALTSTLHAVTDPHEPYLASINNPVAEFLATHFTGATSAYSEMVLFETDVFIEKNIIGLVDESIIDGCTSYDDEPGLLINDTYGLAIELSYYGISDNIEERRVKNPYVSRFQYRQDRALVYSIRIGLLSTIKQLRHLSETQQGAHDVKGHLRHLSNGKIVTVMSHSRKNPKTSSNYDPHKEDNYIVYFAYDSEGVLRYVGEGRPDRPNHIVSGASHNRKINQHFFTKGPMKIRVIHEDLPKDYATAIEAYYIRLFATQLWNVDSNEYQSGVAHSVNWEAHKIDLPSLPVFDTGDEHQALAQL